MRAEHRKHLVQNLAQSIIKHGMIRTSKSNARNLRTYVEKLITRAKTESLHNRRILLSRLHNQTDIVKKLFEIGKLNEKRPGGYVRLVKDNLYTYVQIIDYVI